MSEPSECFLIGTTCSIKLFGLKNTAGRFINGATAVGVLLHENGRRINKCPDIVFINRPNSHGDYFATLDVPSSLIPGNDYKLAVTINGGPGRLLTIELCRKAAVLAA